MYLIPRDATKDFTRRSSTAVLLAAPALVLALIPLYRLLARRLGARRGWYAGFLAYWPLCLGIPLAVVGRKSVRNMLRPSRRQATAPATWLTGLVAAMPVAVAFIDRRGSSHSPRERVGLTITALMNGVLEEVFWRGLYNGRFPTRPVWGVVWPSVWFGLWHFAPGSVLPQTNEVALMAGAGGLGLALGWVTHRTQSIRWAALSHTLAGLVQAWQ